MGSEMCIRDRDQFFGGFFDKCLDHILIGQKITALNGVESVQVETVFLVVSNHAGRSALCRNRVAAHGVDLGDKTDADALIGLDGGDRRTQARATAAYDQYIMVGCVQGTTLLG